MKGFPLESKTEIGGCYRAVNAAIKAAEKCRTMKEVMDILGEPDRREESEPAVTPTKIFKAIGSVFRFGEAEASIVLIYFDPYRPLFRYKFGFVRGILDWKMRETVAAMYAVQPQTKPNQSPDPTAASGRGSS